SMAASRETLKRTSTARCTTRSLTINVVRVWEENPPKGEPAVAWHLYTSLPIKTKKQIERIVDIYRSRWLIEEYFKALKTGCQIERRLFSTLNSWYKMIALYLPIANTLLNLRHMDDSEYVANENRQVLSHTQI
ncbi:MAG: transposase, partial [Bdellovibrionales bacterium]|nr:transposase [Bdellovibrionales bacterium]